MMPSGEAIDVFAVALDVSWDKRKSRVSPKASIKHGFGATYAIVILTSIDRLS
jgi:hypothetical protein